MKSESDLCLAGGHDRLPKLNVRCGIGVELKSNLESFRVQHAPPASRYPQARPWAS